MPVHPVYTGDEVNQTFAILYYAITNKPVKSAKDFRTMSMLNHAQNKLMEQIIDGLGQVKGRI